MSRRAVTFVLRDSGSTEEWASLGTFQSFIFLMHSEAPYHSLPFLKNMEEESRPRPQTKAWGCISSNNQAFTIERIFVLITIRKKRLLNIMLHYAKLAISPQYE